MPKREITKAQYEDVIERLLDFAVPDTSRGPAHPDWIAAITRAAQVLGRPPCTGCRGTGQAQSRLVGMCANCYGIGLEIER